MELLKSFKATDALSGRSMPIYSTKLVGNKIVIRLKPPKMAFRKIDRKPKRKPVLKFWLKAIKSLTNY